MTTAVTELEVEDETEEVEEGTKTDWKPSPIETIHPEDVDPSTIRLFREPAWRLRPMMRPRSSSLVTGSPMPPVS